jgi:hypothetical protein
VKWDAHRWSTVLVVVLAVLDVVVLGVAYRAHNGTLPPWQVREPAYRMTPADATTTTTAGARDDSVTGPLLLSVNPAGLVLRAVRGACEERFHKAAQLAVGRAEDGTMTDLEVPELREALGIMVFADGRLRATGLDESCEGVTLDSVDEGKTWQPTSEGAGIWRLDGDVTALDVIDPTGKPVATPCVPQQIVNLPRQRAIGGCATGGFFELGGADPTPRALTNANLDEVSATPGSTPGTFYAFGAAQNCGAQVVRVSADGQPGTLVTCFGKDRAPLAIASAGHWLVAQVGNYLRSSRDGGQNFTPEPEAAS